MALTRALVLAVLTLVVWGVLRFHSIPHSCVPLCRDAHNGAWRIHSLLEVYQLRHGGELPPRSDWERTLKSQGVVKDTPRDPWGNRYWLEIHGSSFEVRSKGADGIPHTSDDVIPGQVHQGCRGRFFRQPWGSGPGDGIAWFMFAFLFGAAIEARYGRQPRMLAATALPQMASRNGRPAR